MQLLLAPLAGWLAFRRTDFAGALVTSLLGGMLIWFFFASPPIAGLLWNRRAALRGLGCVVAVVGVVLSMRYAVPFALDALAPSTPSVERQ